MRTSSLVAIVLASIASACPRVGPDLALTTEDCVITGAPFSVHAQVADESVVARWRFDMGDGTTELITRSDTHVHTYRKPGLFKVHVVAELEDGRASGAVREVEAQSGVRQCGERPTAPPRRMISVDACRDHGLLACLVDMGSLQAGTNRDHTISITNPGTADTRISSVDILSDEGHAFSIDLPDELVVHPGNDALLLPLHFTPAPGTLHAATLRIISNAENLPTGQTDIRVVLTGSALDAPVPHLTVDPLQCEFGSVVINSTADCAITLANTGNAPVQFISSTFAADVDLFERDPLELPYELHAGESHVLHFRLTPRSVHEARGSLTLETTDPANRSVVIPLHGVGIEREPVALPRIDLVNGLLVLPGQALRPLDDVVVTGVDSMPGRAGRTIVAWHWELVGRPDTSTVQLSSPDEVTTGFTFNSSNAERAGLDVIGVFTLRLTVTDDGGLQNVNDGRLVLSTAAGRGLHVQLTWEDPYSDIDLHLMRTPDSSSAFGADDCFYSNCTQGGNLGWGGGDRNPTLDIDDTMGFGPENIRLGEPELGRSYLVGVHFYARGQQAHADIPARVQVFFDGIPIGDVSHVLTRCNSFWSVGVIHPFTMMQWETRDVVDVVEHASCRDD